MWDTDEGSVGVVEIILPEYIFCDCIWGLETPICSNQVIEQKIWTPL